jgi:hypothetical protein
LRYIGVAVKVVPICRWEDIIKMDLKETGWKGMDCIVLA